MQNIKVNNIISKDGKVLTEGKLIVIYDQKPLKKGDVGHPISGIELIVISESEKIEVGDYIFLNGQIQIAGKNGVRNWKEASEYHKWDCFKILALPEHFSKQQLQDIVDGKMKDGDKVLVECEMMCPNKDGDCEHFNKTGEECTDLVPFIKLNSSNHITLFHKVEEKMYSYTKQQLGELLNQFSYAVCNEAYTSPLGDEEYEINSSIDADKWIEQNVK